MLCILNYKIVYYFTCVFEITSIFNIQRLSKKKKVWESDKNTFKSIVRTPYNKSCNEFSSLNGKKKEFVSKLKK